MKKKFANRKKLELARDTIRRLEENKLHRVAAAGDTKGECVPTISELTGFCCVGS